MAARPHSPLSLEHLEPRSTPSVTSTVRPDGLLVIHLGGPEPFTLAAAGGGVRVNGADPDSGPVAAAAVTTVEITGNAGDDVFDLSAVQPSAFPNLTSVRIDGAGGRDRLLGPDRDQTWLLSGADTGQILGGGTPGSPVFTYSGIADLIGGAGADNFVAADGATLAGGIDGGPGADTLDLGDYSTAVDAVLLGATGIGFSGTATPLGVGFAGIDRLVAGTAADHLTGLAAGGSWFLSDSPTYAIGPSTLGFAGFEELDGGSGPDTFELTGGATGSVTADLSGGDGDDRFDFLDGVVLTGTLEGGPGTDTLSFAGYGAGVDVRITSADRDGYAGTEPVAFSGGGFRGIDVLDPTPGPPALPPSPAPPPSPPQPPTPHSPLAVGTGPGSSPVVVVLDPATGAQRFRLAPYDTSFTGGVRVAVGDVNGDGIPDVVTGAGDGGGPHVRVFDGRTGRPLSGPLGSFFAFDANFRGGVFVAVGDVNGDGYADVVVGAGPGGGPHVRVFSGEDGSPLLSIFAFDPGFTGGVRVAAGDTDGDGRAEVIAAAGPGGGPAVAVFDGTTGEGEGAFFAYDPAFAGGGYVASGDLDGDGLDEVLTGPGVGGGPDVRAFDSQGRVKLRLAPYEAGFRGGVRVAAADVAGDPHPEVIAARDDGSASAPGVFAWPAGAAVTNVLANLPAGPGGVYVG